MNAFPLAILMLATCVAAPQLTAQQFGTPQSCSLLDGLLPDRASDTARQSTRAVATDWDGDGIPDLAVLAPGTAGIELLHNDGEVRFVLAHILPEGQGASSFTFADVDGDQDLDLVVCNSLSHWGTYLDVMLGGSGMPIMLLRNSPVTLAKDGSGTFTPVSMFPAGSGSRCGRRASSTTAPPPTIGGSATLSSCRSSGRTDQNPIVPYPALLTVRPSAFAAGSNANAWL